MLIDGYSEGNDESEQYLHKVMRQPTDDILFETICTVLGRAGSLFSVPILMAFAKNANDKKGSLALQAIDGIRARVNPEEARELKDFFNPEYWRPKWIGTKDKFISYVACLSNFLNRDDFFEGEMMDKTADMLMREMDVDLAPYQSFRELRLCTPGCDLKDDIVNELVGAVDEDLLMGSILDDGQIEISADSKREENVINMRCDYLLTRLGLEDDDGLLHYLLVKAEKLNQPVKS